jgi:hypothetical protein
MRSSNKAVAFAFACLLPWPCPAQAPVPPTSTPPAATIVDAGTTPPLPPSGDALLDALTCRMSVVDIAGLLSRLRRERPDEFVQTERQYSAPMMDLYRLAEPARAWGHASDAIVITDNRVLMLVDGPLDQAAAQLEQELERTRDAPLSGALDDQHALVIYASGLPGLEARTLIGCEYRIEGLSLLEDPQDAWRKRTP